MPTYKRNGINLLDPEPIGAGGIAINDSLNTLSEPYQMLTDLVIPDILSYATYAALLYRQQFSLNPSTNDLDDDRYNSKNVSIYNYALDVSEYVNRGASLSGNAIYIDFALSDIPIYDYEFEYTTILKQDSANDVVLLKCNNNKGPKLYYDNTASKVILEYFDSTITSVMTAEVAVITDFTNWVELIANRHGVCIDGTYTAWTVTNGSLAYKFEDSVTYSRLNLNNGTSNIYTDSVKFDLYTTNPIIASYSSGNNPVIPCNRLKVGMGAALYVYNTLPDWLSNTVYSVGDKVNYNSAAYECTIAGTSDATVPFSNSTAIVDTVVIDNSVTWKCVGYVANMHAIASMYSNGINLACYQASMPIAFVNMLTDRNNATNIVINIQGKFATVARTDILNEYENKRYPVLFPILGSVIDLGIECKTVVGAVDFNIYIQDINDATSRYKLNLDAIHITTSATRVSASKRGVAFAGISNGYIVIECTADTDISDLTLSIAMRNRL